MTREEDERRMLSSPDPVVEVAGEILANEIGSLLGFEDGLVRMDVWNVEERLSFG